MALCTFWRGRKSVTNRGKGGDCAVEELFSCRNGQPQQQPRGSIDYVIHSDNQIRFYVINTHIHATIMCTHTHTYSDMSVKQCRNMNSIRNQITLHLSVLLLALFRSVVHILQALQYFWIILQLVHKQLFLPPSPFIMVQLTNQHK